MLINVIGSNTKHSCCGGAHQGGRTLPRLRHGEVQRLADRALLLLRPGEVDGGVGDEGPRGVERVDRSGERKSVENSQAVILYLTGFPSGRKHYYWL